ncbi:MAG: L,D-transpeptidase family protein [Planctomycetota bacterium]
MRDRGGAPNWVVATAALALLAGALYWLVELGGSVPQQSSVVSNDAMMESAPPPAAESASVAPAVATAAVREESAKEVPAQDAAAQDSPSAQPTLAAVVPTLVPTAPATTPATTPSTSPATSSPAAEPAPATPTAQQAPASKPAGNGFDAVPAAPAPPAAAAGGADAELARGLALAATDPIAARAAISAALLSGSLDERASKQAADTINDIARRLVFTPSMNAGDPLFFTHTVASGESLERIVRKYKPGCDWRFVQRINAIKRPEAIRVGQRLKIPKGPFSAVVVKRDYRLDICLGAGSDRVVIACVPVGLGSENGTPVGRFRVKPGSKLIDPEWRHPHTGEYFASNDPKNPIGEHWLGLEGVEASNAQLAGYGIHGTIDLDSIGHDRSLGCVRLLADDVSLVWDALGDGSEVEIRR